MRPPRRMVPLAGFEPATLQLSILRATRVLTSYSNSEVRQCCKDTPSLLEVGFSVRPQGDDEGLTNLHEETQVVSTLPRASTTFDLKRI